MNRSRLKAWPLAVVAVVATAAGVVTASADGGDPPSEPKRHARPVPVRPSLPRAPAPAPVPCAPRGKSDPKPPSAALLRAFGVLRRERAERDALPAKALDALRQRGLEPADPSSARLLREGPGAGRAWIVPVSNVNAALFPPFLCRPLARAVPPRAARRLRALRLRSERRRRFAWPLDRPHPVPPMPMLAPPVVPGPGRIWFGRVPTKPQEGVAVVAVGGAAVGGGGALSDLLRGRAPVSVEPCAGPQNDMVGVSGLVPDGVASAFLTSEDGTAVRADVVDNAYAFVVPRDRRPQQRYVVWSGSAGTPHVQPVFVPFFVSGRERCLRLPARLAQIPRVSPGPESQFPAFAPFPVPPRSVPPRAIPVPPHPFARPVPKPPRPRSRR